MALNNEFEDDIFFSDSDSEISDEGIDLNEVVTSEEDLHLPEYDLPLDENVNENPIIRGGDQSTESLLTQISILKNYLQLQNQELQTLIHQRASDQRVISQLQNSITNLVLTLSLSQETQRPEDSRLMDGRPAQEVQHSLG